MKILALLLGICSFQLLLAQEYSRVTIYTDSRGLQQLAEMGIAIDHGQIKKEHSFTTDLSQDEIQTIKAAGFQIVYLIEDVQAFYINQNLASTELKSDPTKNAGCEQTNPSNPVIPVPTNFHLGSMGGFYTYQEFLDELDSMASKYPHLISVRDTIGQFLSIQNRPIYWVKISNNPTVDEDEPEVLYTAVHHAREPNSLSQLIFYMWYLLENYDNNEEVKFLVDHTEMYFVPMINPDGYIYNQTTSPLGGGMWRKNRRPNAGGSFGVDLNRNYSYQWGTTGISTNPSNDTYCGTAPFSEPETQAIKWFCEQRDFLFAFNAHTYGNDILYPIGATANEFADDHDYFELFTTHMTKYNGYTHMKSSSLYPASGDSDDYMYKMDLGVKPKIFAMTPEISNTSGGFWPASNQITGICQDMVFPNLMLAHLAHKYLTVNDEDPLWIETLSGNFTHRALRLGQEDGPVKVSITPLAGIASVGSPVIHDLDLMEEQTATIPYTLSPSIQFGDEIKYILNTVYTSWAHRDTITKRYGLISPQILDEATNTSNWTGNWATTTATFVSAPSCFTDSPNGDYANNTIRTFTYIPIVDLSNATAAAIRFYAKWDIEADYDYCQLQVSTDGGTTWIGQCGRFTVPGVNGSGSVQPNGQPVWEGTQTTWVKEEINLSDYIGDSIQIRFVLRSDGGTRADGFYFDDFEIVYNLDLAKLEETDRPTFHLVPNPANHAVKLVLDEAQAGGYLSIYSLNGQFIERIKMEEKLFEMSTSQLKSGVYTLIYEQSGEKSKPIKLVIIH